MSEERHQDRWPAFEEAQREAGIDPSPRVKEQRKSMMKVESLIDGSFLGADLKSFPVEEGEVYEVTAEYGRRLFEAGVAKPADDVAEHVAGEVEAGLADQADEEGTEQEEASPVPEELREYVDEKAWEKLAEAGFDSVEALIEADDKTLQDVKGVGKKTVQAIRAALMDVADESEEDGDADPA